MQMIGTLHVYRYWCAVQTLLEDLALHPCHDVLAGAGDSRSYTHHESFRKSSKYSSTPKEHYPSHPLYCSRTTCQRISSYLHMMGIEGHCVVVSSNAMYSTWILHIALCIVQSGALPSLKMTSAGGPSNDHWVYGLEDQWEIKKIKKSTQPQSQHGFTTQYTFQTENSPPCLVSIRIKPGASQGISRHTHTTASLFLADCKSRNSPTKNHRRTQVSFPISPHGIGQCCIIIA